MRLPAGSSEIETAPSAKTPVARAAELVGHPLTVRVGDENQGPFITFDLRVAEGKIVAATFRTFSCVWASGIGGILSSRLEGRTAEPASVPEVGQVIVALEGIPRARWELAEQAVAALRRGLAEAVPLPSSTPDHVA
jgi:NifU-like protein involved in Fe-S cluster formation